MTDDNNVVNFRARQADGTSVPPPPLPPGFQPAAPAEPPVPEPAGGPALPAMPGVEGMAPPVHLTMPPPPSLDDEDDGAFSPPEPADPDNPTKGETAATALALMVALSVAATNNMWQAGAVLRARAAHRRAIADRARAEADRAAARNKASSGGPGASRGAKGSGGGSGRPLLGGGGSGSSGRKSGSGSTSGGSGRKTAGADKGSAGKAPAVPRVGGGSTRGPGAGGGSKSSDSKRPAGKAPAGSKGPGGGSTKGGGPHGGGSKATDSKRTQPGGRARTIDPKGGAKGGPHGGGSKGSDGTRPLPGGGKKPLPGGGQPGDKQRAKDGGKAKQPGAEPAGKDSGRWQGWAEGRWHGRRDERAKSRQDRRDGGQKQEEDRPQEEEWEKWARERHEDWMRQRQRERQWGPPPGFEGMRPPPAADRAVRITVERMDTQPKARPGLAAPRPQLPAGADHASEGEQMSTPVRTSTRGTQYRDAELTVYDVIEADADMAEEIAAGAVVAVATAGGCDALYTRLERLYAEVSGMQVPGSLQGKVLDLMAQTATVRDRAQEVAAALPAAAEAISTAGTNASARHKPLADAVRDAGHTRPAERDYHNE